MNLLQQALALHKAGDLTGAAAAYRQVLRSSPKEPNALRLLGVIEFQSGRLEKAERLLSKAVAANPSSADAHYFLGRVSIEKKDVADAQRHLARAVELDGRHADALTCLGTLALRSSGFVPALAYFRRALTIDPAGTSAMVGEGHCLVEIGSPSEAVALFDRVLARSPNTADAWYGRGNALRALGRQEPALASYDKAVAFAPAMADALAGRANALFELRRHDEASADYDRAFAIDPELKSVEGQRVHARMWLCDWSGLDEALTALMQNVRAGKLVATPFALINVAGSADDQLTCARLFVADKHPAAASVPVRAARAHEKIRLAYISADLRQHPTSFLAAGLFEQHDRDRFETTAISLYPEQSSPMVDRLKSAFDRFVTVSDRSDAEVVSLMRDLEIDIAVDLMGHTLGARTGILARRCAPVQVSYLGYPGTTGADWIDYIVADRVVIPEHHRSFYSEKVVCLPDSYQVNDAGRAIAEKSFAREDLGLPSSGFVFCCFNANYKILPFVFERWMNILKDVAGSVLWLLEGNPQAVDNLRKEAARRQVDPARLIFAARMPLPEHLARHRCADLFLDTLPCNAHTTASDALWAGLPVLTCRGEAFAGRVAASLLTSTGLPELIATSLEEYEALAVALARDGARLAQVRARLARNRATCPLFDTVRFTRHIEAAYVEMWQRYQKGLVPESFVVEPIEEK